MGFRYAEYAYGRLTELKKVLGTGMKVLKNSHKFRVGRTRMNVLPAYPYPHLGTSNWW